MRKQKIRKKRVVRDIVLNDNKEMLLVRQKTRQLWQFPGGIIHANEEPLRAALREAREETQLRLKGPKLIHIETVLTDVVEEKVFVFFEKIGKAKGLAPDGNEIDKLAWRSIQKSFDLPLTDTTKVLLSNLAIIELFV